MPLHSIFHTYKSYVLKRIVSLSEIIHFMASLAGGTTSMGAFLGSWLPPYVLVASLEFVTIDVYLKKKEINMDFFQSYIFFKKHVKKS
ncbi:hypothetical protein ACJX0J_026430, partial [Zea mays]